MKSLLRAYQVFVFGLGLCVASTLMAQVRTLDLGFVDGEEVLEAVRPLMKAGETVSFTGTRLVISAGAATQSKVKALISALDRPRENLVITLRGKSGELTYGETGRLVSRGQGESENRWETSTLGGRGVYTLNGSSVFIETDAPEFQVSRQGVVTNGRGAGAIYAEGGVHRRGVWVLPRVRGDKVILKLSSPSSTLLPTKTEAPKDYAMVLTGQLGEWLSLSEQRPVSSTSKGGVWTIHSGRGGYTGFEVRVTRLSP